MTKKTEEKLTIEVRPDYIPAAVVEVFGIIERYEMEHKVRILRACLILLTGKDITKDPIGRP